MTKTHRFHAALAVMIMMPNLSVLAQNQAPTTSDNEVSRSQAIIDEYYATVTALQSEHNEKLNEIERRYSDAYKAYSEENVRRATSLAEVNAAAHKALGNRKLSNSQRNTESRQLQDEDKHRRQEHANWRNSMGHDIHEQYRTARQSEIDSHKTGVAEALAARNASLAQLGNANAKPAGPLSGSESEKISNQFLRHARELREVAAALKLHARTAIPAELTASQSEKLALSRRELLSDAEAVLRLAIELDTQRIKAQQSALTQEDLNSIAAQSIGLSMRSNERLSRAGLSSAISAIEGQLEDNRNRGEKVSTAFQSHDQRSNDLYRLLLSVVKAMDESRSASARDYM